MAPKKAAVAAADSSESSPTGESSKPNVSTVRKLATHPPTAIMVREAIKELDSRKGVSSQAIQKFIKQKYPSVDLTRLKGLVRRALIKGLESGTLVRPANASAGTGTGATGRFRLAKSNVSKAKSENVDPNMQKAPKAEKNGDKEPKKKKPADKKKEEREKPSEEPKLTKKSKKDDPSSKAATVKKPKVAKTAAQTADEHSETVKPKGKAKAVKEDKGEKPAKAGKAQKEKEKAAQSKAKANEPPGKAQGKRGKKAPE